MVRMFEGRFGRLVLHDLRASEPIEAPTDPAIILGAHDAAVRFLNPGEIHISLDASRVLVLHAAGDWLLEGGRTRGDVNAKQGTSSPRARPLPTRRPMPAAAAARRCRRCAGRTRP